jgi:hypothetical protein
MNKVELRGVPFWGREYRRVLTYRSGFPIFQPQKREFYQLRVLLKEFADDAECLACFQRDAIRFKMKMHSERILPLGERDLVSEPEACPRTHNELFACPPYQ